MPLADVDDTDRLLWRTRRISIAAGVAGGSSGVSRPHGCDSTFGPAHSRACVDSASLFAVFVPEPTNSKGVGLNAFCLLAS